MPLFSTLPTEPSLLALSATIIGLLVVGVGSGTLAGLLGVGGGIIIVPALYWLLPLSGLEPALWLHVAIATSLAVIMPTALSSARAHYRRGGLDVKLLRLWGGPIALGALLGGLVARAISAQGLAIFFALAATAIALNLAFGGRHTKTEKPDLNEASLNDKAYKTKTPKDKTSQDEASQDEASQDEASQGEASQDKASKNEAPKSEAQATSPALSRTTRSPKSIIMNSAWFQPLAALGSGLGSALMGIGGGSFVVPILSMLGTPIHRAIGTAAALGIAVSLPATIGFIASGWSVPSRLPFSLGYVSLPLAVLIALSATPSARLGANLAHRAKPIVLRRIFALFLMVTVAKIAYTALF